MKTKLVHVVRSRDLSVAVGRNRDGRRSYAVAVREPQSRNEYVVAAVVLGSLAAYCAYRAAS